ncbi:hypothetical protein [Okeania sp. KiyG1]|uniref:hypothetical protein n=1 Tax=Okeania sp. KiyG1 TaxID=2720165 RepID=UPI00192198DB|nr:hypothetical protein [Okeania sp. KiyG1]
MGGWGDGEMGDGELTKSEVRSQKSEVKPPLTPTVEGRGSRGFELRSKNIAP